MSTIATRLRFLIHFQCFDCVSKYGMQVIYAHTSFQRIK